MDAQIREKASALFNNLNRYLSLINYKPDARGGPNIYRGYNFTETCPNTFESAHFRALDETYKKIEAENARRPEYDPKFDAIIAEVTLEQDGLGLDPKNCYYSQYSRLDSDESAVQTEGERSLSDEPSDRDDELISNLSSDAGPEEEEAYVGSADSNFVNYTYWSVETGDNVSTTTKPMYFNAKDCKVSLLEEAEAFVAGGFWGNDPNLFKYTPRHLLLQVTQIANRAFFDPDYRKYLQHNYV